MEGNRGRGEGGEVSTATAATPPCAGIRRWNTPPGGRRPRSRGGGMEGGVWTPPATAAPFQQRRRRGGDGRTSNRGRR